MLTRGKVLRLAIQAEDEAKELLRRIGFKGINYIDKGFDFEAESNIFCETNSKFLIEIKSTCCNTSRFYRDTREKLRDIAIENNAWGLVLFKNWKLNKWQMISLDNLYGLENMFNYLIGLIDISKLTSG